MPKTTETSKTTKTNKTNVNNNLVETKKAESNVLLVNEKANSDDKQKKSVRKAGRTILVKSISGNSIESKVFDDLTGLVSCSETKSLSSYFLTFDTVSNSVNAFKKLQNDSADYKVKFSYYRVFFTINGLSDLTDYNQVKQDISSFITNKTNSTVLYCKLYRKDEKYIGCGDFTIDTMNGMNTLLAKEGGLKDFTIGQLTGTFYRYNGKKDKLEQENSNITVEN